MSGAPRAGAPLRGQWMGRLMATPWRLRAHGKENVPASGGALMVANHVTLIDGPMVYTASPRDLHMLVKKEAFKGWVGKLLDHVGQIPIDRKGHDRGALATAVEVMERGDLVGIFPEGTRTGGMAESVRMGAAHLALTASVPVIPVAVLGTWRPGDRSKAAPPVGRRIDVVFGAPVELAAGEVASGRQRRERASAELQALLATHVAAAAEQTGQQLGPGA